MGGQPAKLTAVTTRIRLKPGTVEDCARLFRDANADLVRDEPDWLSGRMIFVEAAGEIVVTAIWRSADSYRHYAASARFKEAIARFLPFFAEPPRVSFGRVLVDMARTPDGDPAIRFLDIG